jgi:hypothetical protein
MRFRGKLVVITGGIGKETAARFPSWNGIDRSTG